MVNVEKLFDGNISVEIDESKKRMKYNILESVLITAQILMDKRDFFFEKGSIAKDHKLNPLEQRWFSSKELKNDRYG